MYRRGRRLGRRVLRRLDDVTAEGANQSVTGTAIDVAGNTESATVADINIDKTAPTLSGARRRPARTANGWYNGDVTIHWTCSDALVGHRRHLPGRRHDHRAKAPASRASRVGEPTRPGNTTNATSSPAVNIDRTAPIDIATAPPAWNNTDVTVNLSASDALSGVAATHWIARRRPDADRHDGAGHEPRAIHTLDVLQRRQRRATSRRRNTLHVRIDKTAPTIGAHAVAARRTATAGTTPTSRSRSRAPTTLSGIAELHAPRRRSRPKATNQASPARPSTTPATRRTIRRRSASTRRRRRSLGARPRRRTPTAGTNADVTVTLHVRRRASRVSTPAPRRRRSVKAPIRRLPARRPTRPATPRRVTDAHINVDKTAPTITGAPTTDAERERLVQRRRHDPLDVHRRALRISRRARPTASSRAAAADSRRRRRSPTAPGTRPWRTSPPVNIDRIAPETTSDAPAGWQTANFTVQLLRDRRPLRRRSHVLRAQSRTVHAGTSVGISTEGMTLIDFWSVDAAGNVEASSRRQCSSTRRRRSSTTRRRRRRTTTAGTTAASK